MSDTKFTPGPWFAEQQQSKDGESLGWIINHADGRIGWSSYATRVPNAGERAPHPIGAANAHLIAAAPEMHALLVQLDENIERLDHGIYSLESREGFDAQLFMDNLRDALAKALGS